MLITSFSCEKRYQALLTFYTASDGLGNEVSMRSIYFMDTFSLVSAGWLESGVLVLVVAVLLPVSVKIAPA